MVVLAPAEMPLAAERRVVPDRTEHLRHRHHVASEQPSSTTRVEPRDDRRPRRRALRVVVELAKAKSFLGQSIDVRRFDFAAVAAEIGPPHVVTEDEDDIGAVVRAYLRRNGNDDDPEEATAERCRRRDEPGRKPPPIRHARFG